MADVANIWPLDPTPSTMIDAMTTIKSVRDGDSHCNLFVFNQTLYWKPIIAWMIKSADKHNQNNSRSKLFYMGEKEKARCTYDWYGLPDKAEAPFDACIFAATACRPQPDHILCAKEEHQHNLLWSTMQTQSTSYIYPLVQRQLLWNTYRTKGSGSR